MEKKRIGFIGYRGHAARLIKIFDGLALCQISHFYHPEKEIDIDLLPIKDKAQACTTRNLADLYSCDGIVISSPNHTHFKYLKKFAEDYKGYIFCEKPPVTEPEELEALSRFPIEVKKRTHFDFNMRFGALFDILKTFPKRYDLGEPISSQVIVGHGLGFKESYKSSWRSKARFHKAGVFETMGIHYFDLISFFFGPPVNFFHRGQTHSPYGDSIDTSHLSCSFANRSFLNLTASYCMPFVENMQVHYTNGYIDFDVGVIKVHGPRETFDKNGFFMKPPVMYEDYIDMDSLYLESLRNSCSFFIDSICRKQEITLKYFEQSVSANKMCLDIRG